MECFVLDLKAHPAPVPRCSHSPSPGHSGDAGTAPAPGSVQCAIVTAPEPSLHHIPTAHPCQNPSSSPRPRVYLERSDPLFVSWLVCSCRQRQPSESKEIQSLAVPRSPLPCCRTHSHGWAGSNCIKSHLNPSRQQQPGRKTSPELLAGMEQGQLPPGGHLGLGIPHPPRPRRSFHVWATL